VGTDSHVKENRGDYEDDRYRSSQWPGEESLKRETKVIRQRPIT
jgi:hypothetical protein